MRKVIFWIIIMSIGLAIVSLFSCRASKTTTTEHTVSSDSSFTKTAETQSVKTDKTKITDQRNIETKGVVKLTFQYPDSPTQRKIEFTKTGNSVNDALQYLMNQNPKTVTIDGDISILDHSHITTEFDTKDSSTGKEETKGEVKNVDTAKTGKVDVKQWSFWGLFPWYVWLILLIIAIIAGRIAYVKYLKPFLIIKRII